jgi:ATP-dependent Clp protease ATP-binding subunit ClpC
VDVLKKQGSLGFATRTEEDTYEKMKDKLLTEVKRHFKPEFLNRIDDIIVFKPLTKDHLYKIIELEIAEVSSRLKDRAITIELSPEAIDFLIEKGFDPVFGARPLKRTIQRFLEDPLSEALISGTFKDGSKIAVRRENDKLAFV